MQSILAAVKNNYEIKRININNQKLAVTQLKSRSGNLAREKARGRNSRVADPGRGDCSLQPSYISLPGMAVQGLREDFPFREGLDLCPGGASLFLNMEDLSGGPNL